MPCNITAPLNQPLYPQLSRARSSKNKTKNKQERQRAAWHLPLSGVGASYEQASHRDMAQTPKRFALTSHTNKWDYYCRNAEANCTLDWSTSAYNVVGCRHSSSQKCV